MKISLRVLLTIFTLLFAVGVYGNTVLKNVFFVSLIDDVLITMIFGYMLFSKTSIIVSNISKPIYVFLMALLISSALNMVKFAVIAMQIRSLFLPFVLIGFLRSLDINEQNIYSLIRRWVVIIIPCMLIGLYETLTRNLVFTSIDRFGNSISETAVFRASSTIGNPIDFGAIMLVFFSLLLSNGLCGLKPILSWRIDKAMMMISAINTFGSNSRGPMIALLLLFGVLFYFRKIRKAHLMLSISSLLFIVLIFREEITARFSLLEFDISQSDGYREIWLLKSINIIRDYIWFGVGPGMYGGWVSINFISSPIYSLYNVDTDGISSIDMFFVHLMAEVGVIGLILYLRIFWRYFKDMIAFVRLRFGLNAVLALTAVLTMVANIFLGLTSILLESQLILVNMCFVLGLVFNRLKYEKKDSLYSFRG